MLLHAVVRDALETQVLEHEPGQAALVLRGMVAETDEAFDLDELLERLAVDGAVAPDSVDVLSRMLTVAAATAGGIRPVVDPLVAELGPERVLFGAWLALLSIVRIVAISLERTEADVTDEVVSVLETS